MSKINESWYSSNTDQWATPQAFFDILNAEFGFSLDVCALPHSSKCCRYFSPEDDGLAQPWNGHTCWMNPPYGKTIGDWMQKAVEESAKGALVACLVPARVDTKWWHEWVMGYADEVRLVKGRLKFGDAKNAAPFPSALVIYKRYTSKNMFDNPAFTPFDWRK